MGNNFSTAELLACVANASTIIRLRHKSKAHCRLLLSQSSSYESICTYVELVARRERFYIALSVYQLVWIDDDDLDYLHVFRRFTWIRLISWFIVDRMASQQAHLKLVSHKRCPEHVIHHVHYASALTGPHACRSYISEVVECKASIREQSRMLACNFNPISDGVSEMC